MGSSWSAKGQTERERAITDGLLLGDCEWCGDDVWSDRSPDSVRYGGYLWHHDCAKRCYEVLQEALWNIDPYKPIR